jgi:hypothetical protein
MPEPQRIRDLRMNTKPVSWTVPSVWYIVCKKSGLPLFPGWTPPAANACGAWIVWEQCSRLSKKESKKRGYKAKRFKLTIESI